MYGKEGRVGPLLDVAAGAAAGLAGTWVMSLVHQPIMRSGGEATRRREKEAQGGMPPATIRAAEAAAGVAGKPLSPERKRVGGKLVHYAYGIAWGVGFALAARSLARSAPLRWPLAAGAAFGAALWVLSDEVLVPLFRFSRPPTRYPASTHVKGLAAHLVYGVATEASWRLFRAATRASLPGTGSIG
jgi:hypothetical protein